MFKPELMGKAKKGYLLDGHISPSQLSVWAKSKKNYIKQYYFGEKWAGNKYTRLGLKVHEIIDKGSENEGENTLKIIVDTYLAQHAIDIENEQNVTHKVDGVTYQVIFDKVSFTSDFIMEAKSGLETSWTQDIVNAHQQLHFQEMMYQWKKGKVPTAKLLHIITDKEGNVTGKIKSYNFEPTLKDRKKFIRTLDEFFDWCNTLTEKDVQAMSNEVDYVDDEIKDTFDIIVSLKADIEDKEKAMKSYREKASTYLQLKAITKYEHAGTSFFFTEKKIFEFSPEIKSVQKKIEDLKASPEIKELEAELDTLVEDFKVNNEPLEIKKILTVK